MPDPWCTAPVHAATATAYQDGCRCADARRANARARIRYELRVLANDGQRLTVPALGTGRRLRSLMVAGFSGTDLARRLAQRAGLQDSRVAVHRWTGEHQRRVYLRVAVAVRDLYDDLESEEGPSLHTRNRSAARGWPGPERWFGLDLDDPLAVPRPPEPVELDEGAVYRLVGGDLDPAAACREELLEAVRILHVEQGLSRSAAADLMRLSERQVDYLWLQQRERGLGARRGV